MDFTLPEELRMMQETLRRFVDSELIPHEREISDAEGVRPEWLPRLEARAKELGIWMMEVPEEHGGIGLSVLGCAVVWQELSRTAALPVRNIQITGPTVRGILYGLTGALKEKYLLPTLRGERRSCFAQTEPGAGSDPGAMRTVAQRDGDGYVINGTKSFITGADKADFMQLMALTDRSKGSRGGISCFLVDMDTPGVTVTTSYKTMMGDLVWEIALEGVRVPAENLVGQEGGGFSLAQDWIQVGRVKHGARALGVAQRCLEMSAAYAKQRVTFGKPLADRQAIQWMLADMYMELEIARLLVYRAASLLSQGMDARVETYQCKFYSDEMAFKAADACMQIHGGIGLTTDLPIEKFWRQQRSSRITEGPSEVMKMVIARHVLKTFA
jgi:acyl-CoA dehydrogenase